MKILVVEDDRVTRVVLDRILSNIGHEVTACASAEEAIEPYKAVFHPLIFLDLYLPGMDGFSFCRWIRTQPDGGQHIVLIGTGSDRIEDLQRILEAGADDYLMKPYDADVLEVRLTIAQQRLKNLEARNMLEANLSREQERLRHLATHDPLTGLRNRLSFVETLQNLVEAAREGDRGALVYIDLDNFKLINDSLGHAVGDKVLTNVADVIRESVRSGDVPFRLGGDEFALLLRGLGLPEATVISERVRARIEEVANSDSGEICAVGASIGIAVIDGSASEDALMAFADSACYSAKAHGRNRIEVYDGSEQSTGRSRHRKPRIAEISEALRARKLEIVFQPVVELATATVDHYEVLVSLWSNGAILPPGEFLPTAECFRLMPEVDRQVIAKALPFLAANSLLNFSINLSGQSFQDEKLTDFIESSFDAAGVEPRRVIFEITETAMISNMAAARATRRRLGAAGFRFALDDFGTGFSSFSYLKDLGVDYLKIDGHFVRDAESDPEGWLFVEMMNDVAHRLKIFSVGEFVERESVARSLREIGVDFGQGHYFGKPSELPLFGPVASNGTSRGGRVTRIAPAEAMDAKFP